MKRTTAWIMGVIGMGIGVVVAIVITGIDRNRKNESADPLISVPTQATETVDQPCQGTGDAVSTNDAAVDMSSWKIYRNEKFGFEFAYPGDWLLKDNIDRYGNVVLDDQTRFAALDEDEAASSAIWIEVRENGGVGFEVGFDVIAKDITIDGRCVEKITFFAGENFDETLTADAGNDVREFYKKYVRAQVDFVAAPDRNDGVIRLNYGGDKTKEKYFDAFLTGFRFIDAGR